MIISENITVVVSEELAARSLFLIVIYQDLVSELFAVAMFVKAF